MASRWFEVDSRRTSEALRSRLADDLLRLSEDAGLSTRELAGATGLDHGHIARILRGETRPTIETYAKLSFALGADLSARLYPNTGPLIRDKHQARILEGLLEQVHPRWRPFTEVPVRKPARGWIDVAFHDARAGILVATEIQSDLRRLEQTIRWSQEKADSLPSWAGWSRLTGPPEISRPLVVRRTRATRSVATEFARQLMVAYPGHPDDAVAALTASASWPGPALVWVAIDGGRVRFMMGR